MKIVLNEVTDVNDFVKTTTALDYDVDICKGRYTIDGKSLMGIFSIDLSEPVELYLHTECNDDYNLFKKWEVKG